MFENQPYREIPYHPDCQFLGLHLSSQRISPFCRVYILRRSRAFLNSTVFGRSILDPSLELSNEKMVLILFFVIEKHITTWTIYLIVTLKTIRGFKSASYGYLISPVYGDTEFYIFSRVCLAQIRLELIFGCSKLDISRFLFYLVDTITRI